jgi:signal recognition particle subunit SRP54
MLRVVERSLRRWFFCARAKRFTFLLSSVAATKTPIIFLGTGEHLTDLDRFAPQPFISKLLGLGDVQGLMEHMQDLATQNPDRQKEMAKKLEEGKLSIRDWREQIQNVMNL